MTQTHRAGLDGTPSFGPRWRHAFAANTKRRLLSPCAPSVRAGSRAAVTCWSITTKEIVALRRAGDPDDVGGHRLLRSADGVAATTAARAGEAFEVSGYEEVVDMPERLHPHHRGGRVRRSTVPLQPLLGRVRKRLPAEEDQRAARRARHGGRTRRSPGAEGELRRLAKMPCSGVDRRSRPRRKKGRNVSVVLPLRW